MARRRYGFDEARIARFIKQGRGQGTGKNYKPWLTVADVPSLGRSHRVFCPKTGREHHLLSDNEYYAFLQQWWDDGVLDIREQYPLLDRRETLSIAAECGIKHPRDPISGALWVITTDLLVQRRTSAGTEFTAFAVKPAEDLSDGRVLDKLDIERRWWQRRGIPWLALIDEHLKTRRSLNLAWILDAGQKLHPSADIVFEHLDAAISMQACTPLRMVCSAVDQVLGFPAGTALGIARRLLSEKRLLTNLDTPLIPDLPMEAFTTRRLT